jgi:hypothetical protein
MTIVRGLQKLRELYITGNNLTERNAVDLCLATTSNIFIKL